MAAQAMATSRLPVIVPGQTYGSITDHIVGIPTRSPSLQWIAAFGFCFSLFLLMAVSIGWVLAWGVGIWGINIPVGWGFAIVNFIWWVGIGHAGTLISAILLLLRQEWRTSINRFAETMTLFALANAGLFPLLHLGRIWKFYYMLVYPTSLGTWPQWRSPLVWDMVAVMTYAIVSLIFWYTGLIPDLATMRDSAKRRWAKVIAGIFALGWRGSSRHWQRQQAAYLLIAGLATPLVVSVHSIVSLDFAVGIVPGWHTTIFPPYWVAGAIFSGFAMVLTIVIPVRHIFHFEKLVTKRHLDNLGKLLLLFGLIVVYGYIFEMFNEWFSADKYERYMAVNRALGAYAPIFWIMVVCNVLMIQLLWFRRVRRSESLLWIISILCNIGIWADHYGVVIVDLHRDFMPSAWGSYHGTFWDWALLLGAIGFFAMNYMLFCRFVPMISMSEVRDLLHKKDPSQGISEQGGMAEGQESIEAEAAVIALPVPDDKLYGIIAEFERPEQVVEATKQVRAAGYQRFDAYTPFPVESLPEAMGHGKTAMSRVVLTGALFGAIAIYLTQWLSATWAYPWNIGGRPYNSWPAFIPLTFEMAMLFGAIFALVGMIALNGLPRPYHSIFNALSFERATRDRFFLCIEKEDARFDRREVQALLQTFKPIRVSAVPL